MLPCAVTAAADSAEHLHDACCEATSMRADGEEMSPFEVGAVPIAGVPSSPTTPPLDASIMDEHPHSLPCHPALPNSTSSSSVSGLLLFKVSSSPNAGTPWQYRLQLNTLQLTTETLPAHLERAMRHVVDNYAQELRQRAQGRSSQACLPAASEGFRVVPPIIDTTTAAAASPDRLSSHFSPAQSSCASLGTMTREALLAAFACAPLVEVTFNHNRLSDDALPLLTEFLASNQHIRSFEVLGNALTDAGAPHLRQLLKRCTHLQRIKLADNSLTDITAQVIGRTIFEESMALCLKSGEPLATQGEAGATVTPSQNSAVAFSPPPPFPCPTRRRFLQLNIGGNPIGTEGIRSLCEAALISGMQILGLRGVKMTPEGWACCGALCAAYPHLRRRMASAATPSSAIDPDDENACDFDRVTCNGVSELQLKTNPMTNECMESFVASALAAAQLQLQAAANVVSPDAEQIPVESNPSPDPSTVHPSTHALRAYCVVSTLSSLTLECCSIDAVMTARLVDLLAVATRLSHLDLTKNVVGDDGCSYLCAWLLTDASLSLESLSLENNRVTIRGLQSLTTALCSRGNGTSTGPEGPVPNNTRVGGNANPSTSCISAATDSATLSPQQQPTGTTSKKRSLKVLDIGSNTFGVAATPLLIEILQSTPTLEKLFLRNCRFGGPQHLPSLVNALAQLQHLSDIDFTSNFSGDEGHCWQTLITRSTTVRRLLLTDNGMPASATTAIVNAVVRSTNSQLVVLQIGGKSWRDPIGNIVTPVAHAAVLKAIERNRNGSEAVWAHDTSPADGAPAPPVPSRGLHAAQPTAASGRANAQVHPTTSRVTSSTSTSRQLPTSSAPDFNEAALMQFAGNAALPRSTTTTSTTAAAARASTDTTSFKVPSLQEFMSLSAASSLMSSSSASSHHPQQNASHFITSYDQPLQAASNMGTPAPLKLVPVVDQQSSAVGQHQRHLQANFSSGGQTYVTHAPLQQFSQQSSSLASFVSVSHNAGGGQVFSMIPMSTASAPPSVGSLQTATFVTSPSPGSAAQQQTFFQPLQSAAVPHHVTTTTPYYVSPQSTHVSSQTVLPMRPLIFQQQQQQQHLIAVHHDAAGQAALQQLHPPQSTVYQLVAHDATGGAPVYQQTYPSGYYSIR